MSEYSIETRELCKSYGQLAALKQVSIHVRTGSIYGLVGDNGSGKSTLLKLLAGHSFPTSGEVNIIGQHEEKALRRVRRRMGFMVETTGFHPNMTVEQTLKYYSIQKGIAEEDKIYDLLQITGLTEKRKSRCKNLSLGQKQRLGLAIALIGDPQILVLDEPINGLDPSGILEFRNLLQDLNQNKQMTILISSHILSELQHIASHYGFLSYGQLVEEISATELHNRCSDRLEMTVSDLEAFSVLLEQELPAENFQVLSDDTLIIHQPQEKLEVYSRLAAQHDIYITNMKMIESSLEEYYIQLKKRQ